MYIWAGKSAPFLGDIKKKELLEKALVVEDAVFIYIILPSTFPILNLWYSVSIYYVLLMCCASVGRSEKVREGSCTPHLAAIERFKVSFCRWNYLQVYVISILILKEIFWVLKWNLFFLFLKLLMRFAYLISMLLFNNVSRYLNFPFPNAWPLNKEWQCKLNGGTLFSQ